MAERSPTKESDVVDASSGRQGISEATRKRFEGLRKRRAEESRIIAETRDKRRRKRKRKPNRTESPSEGATTANEEWKIVQDKLNFHEKFEKLDEEKSGLEKKIDEAIEAGNFAVADERSDELSRRDFAVKLTKAFDWRHEEKKRKEAEAEKRAKSYRKRKFYWGFDVKEKWERKSNM